jgi:hypothetical protein
LAPILLPMVALTFFKLALLFQLFLRRDFGRLGAFTVSHLHIVGIGCAARDH